MKKLLLLLVVLLPIFAPPAQAYHPRSDDYRAAAGQYEVLKDRYNHVLDMRDRYGANVRINDKIGRFDNMMKKLRRGLEDRDADPRKLRDLASDASDLLSDIEVDLRNRAGGYDHDRHDHVYRW